ncbi:calcineurin [bacterium]|nr:MAG: calcineurin [bacterium]
MNWRSMTTPSCLISLLFILVASSSGASEIPRIVAIGDLHGDLDATRRALRLGGAIDHDDNWIGGQLIVVQTGDQLDRGDDEQEILDLFEELRIQARQAGGAFHALLGNHEIMNAKGDFRYVTEGGFKDFEDAVHQDSADSSLARYPQLERARRAAFLPGRPYALLLAERIVILQLGDNVFVHGGVLPQHVDYGIDRINAGTQAWMRGEAERPEILEGSDSPQWTRLYSDEPDSSACAVLGGVLKQLGAKRIIMGHSVQELGIDPACDSLAWRIDVGLAAHYGGDMQVLEIIGDEIRVLKE